MYVFNEDPGLIEALVAAYGLGPVDDATRAESGTMNETFLVRAGGRNVVLRRHRMTDRAAVEREHQVMAFTRARGVPIPALLRTDGGDQIVERGGRWHSMIAYAPGYQVDGADLDVAKAYSMGAMLARIQVALRDFPDASDNGIPPQGSAAPTLRRLRDVQAAIRARADMTEQDHQALAYLESKAEALRISQTPPVLEEPRQLVHGDYQHNNLFFDRGDVVAVIDWDKAEHRAPSHEVIRVMSLSLKLQPSLCQALLDGYRDRCPVAISMLDAAARQYSFEQLHDLWVHETVYLRNNDALRRFFTPPPFVPFATRWAELRTSLA